MPATTKRPLRVLMVTGVYPTESAPHLGTFIKSQAESLRAQGLEVEVIHPTPGRPSPARYAWATLRVFLKTLGGRYDIVHGRYVLFGNNPRRPAKNYPLALAAMERLRSRGIEAELVVAHGLPQATVVQYINASNVIMLPSIHEGSPNIVKETMACNVPVVSTN